jgi:PBP1b-binding outer membrane lipoprotein LpoB
LLKDVVKQIVQNQSKGEITMNRIFALIITVLVLLSGCTSVPTKDIQVEAQADPKAQISGYKTYAWLVNAAILNDTYGQWEPPAFDADAEIKYLIDRELRKRGMSEKSVDPDIMVAYAAGIDMDVLELKVDPKGDINVKNVPKGGLVILLVDSRTGLPIWMGVATADIQDRPDTQTAKGRLDYAVTKMIKLLPK